MTRKKYVTHLVGSVPLKDTEDVLRTISSSLGNNLRRVPDGETGKRSGWIKFMENYFNNLHPDMETDEEAPYLKWRQWDGKLLREVPLAKFKNGVDHNSVTFNTGYAEQAIDSFSTYDRLQSEGIIPTDVKFQVCIPTPLAPAYNFIAPGTQDQFIPIYTQHIIDEIEKISSTLPNNRISLQWDVCQEVLMWESYYDYERLNYKEEILSTLSKIGNAVPKSIELGYHLCYGSPRDEHLVQPKDTQNMVEIITGLLSSIKRTIHFIHLPVPKDRFDDDYFKPLSTLNLPEDTDLYLGLVHVEDDKGNLRRIETAKKFVKFNGIGSECGWGRTDPQRIPGLLETHANILKNLN